MINILTTPILNNITVVDSRNNNIIKFNAVGGEQIYGHHIEIYDNNNNTLVYQDKSFSFLFQFEIKPNTLLNGKEYKVRLRTFNNRVLSDFSNIENNCSSFSDYLLLKCYSTPIVAINNFSLDSSDNKMIKNQTYQFVGSYEQAENVPLKSFRFLLYNKNGILIQSFNEVFQLSGQLKQEITGFINEETYFIELITINQYDVTASSGKIKFYVQYTQPRIRQVISAVNDYKNASIKVEAKIVRVLFEGTGYVFELDDFINLKNGHIWIDKDSNFNIDNNFTLKMWVKNITENKDFLTIVSEQGTMRIILKEGRFHIYKQYNNSNFYSHHASDVIGNKDNNTMFFIFLQQINGMLNIKFEK